MENEFCCWKYYLGLFMCKLFHHISPKTISKRRVRILSIIGEFKHFWADDDGLSDVLGFLKSWVFSGRTYFEPSFWPISWSGRGPQLQFCRVLYIALNSQLFLLLFSDTHPQNNILSLPTCNFGPLGLPKNPVLRLHTDPNPSLMTVLFRTLPSWPPSPLLHSRP